MNIVEEILNYNNQTPDSWRQARKNNEYEFFGVAGGDEIECLVNKLLKFKNQLPSLCYAYGIDFHSLKIAFPELFSIQYHYEKVKGESWPTFEQLETKDFSNVAEHILTEIFDLTRWDWVNLEKRKKEFEQGSFNPYAIKLDIHDQLNFIKQNKIRTPNNVLEIGGGRGEIANSLKYLNVGCTSIEPGLYADRQFTLTGMHFFGEEFEPASPRCQSLAQITGDIDLSIFDTIIFCESIEHVQEAEFWNFWHLIQTTFKGLVIITNSLYYHPISSSWPEHLFEISDMLYDQLISQSKSCVYRNNSHLVLNI